MIRPRQLLFLLFLYGSGVTAHAQSTLAQIDGSVHDASGAIIPGATVTLHRRESNTDTTLPAGSDGNYTALDLLPGTYDITVQMPGFGRSNNTGVHLDARQQLRFDVALQPDAVTTQVNVDASDTGVINTENAAVSAALSPQDVLALPANYRGNGSTSPLTVIQTLPGVQPDSAPFPPSASSSPNAAVKFSIQGGLPSQSETTVDGISAQNLTTNNVQADAFPSAESIAEIRVDGVNNNAEYGQPGEITTLTKQGTNSLHGSAFEYFQNAAFDAIPYGDATKPHKVANDFGGSLGGPVFIPHVYNGRDKTFFFATYEGLRFPQSAVQLYVVPTVLMKQGNFSQETKTLNNPFTGIPYANQTLPSINPSAQAFLSLFPDPNIGDTKSLAGALASPLHYNYQTQKDTSIQSNQFDTRIDQNFGSKAFVFGRFTWKNIAQAQPNALLLPESSGTAQYRIFASAFNYTFTPNLSNEFRFGFTLEQDGASNSFNGAAVTNAAKFQGIGPNYPFNGISELSFVQLTTLSTPNANGRLTYQQQSRNYQYVDNITWQKGTHTMRFGGDIRALEANTPVDATGGDNYGTFLFNGNYTGQEFADFLIGAPYQSYTDNITTNNRGRAKAYAFYAQDNWRATQNLNVTFGLRYEYHPAFNALDGNLGNFDPSVAKIGRIIYPAGHANLLSAPALANYNACATAGVYTPPTNIGTPAAPCTPLVTNTQAGLPNGLRTVPKLRFMPRLGFAYRPFGNSKTVISAGAGYYNITTSGAIFYALTGTLQTDLQTFNNSPKGQAPSIVFPNVGLGNGVTPQYGTASYNSPVDLHWHDPYSLQTALSIEHEFAGGLAARLSYIGLQTKHLVWQPNYNDLPLSTTTIAANQPLSAFPFPNYQTINGRNAEASAHYHSFQAELDRRFRHGLSFTSSYTLAKNLADDQGTYGSFASTPATFSDEQGGYYATWSGDRRLDYGNVTATRRNRLLLTGLTDIPVGRGRQFGSNMPRLLDTAIGGWQLSNIFVYQTGPFLTPFIPAGITDPSGTGSSSLFGRPQRPDRVAKGNISAQSRHQWFNTGAFACPGGGDFGALQSGTCTTGVGSAPIGRFGTERVGSVVGPGTVNLSTGVNKTIAFTERVHLRAEGTFTNILNHTNLADPTLDVTSPAFGTITQARGSDFGGNRTGQASLRLEF